MALAHCDNDPLATAGLEAAWSRIRRGLLSSWCAIPHTPMVCFSLGDLSCVFGPSLLLAAQLQLRMQTQPVSRCQELRKRQPSHTSMRSTAIRGRNLVSNNTLSTCWHRQCRRHGRPRRSKTSFHGLASGKCPLLFPKTPDERANKTAYQHIQYSLRLPAKYPVGCRRTFTPQADVGYKETTQRVPRHKIFHGKA